MMDGKRVGWFHLLLASFQHALSNLGLSYRYGHLRRDKWRKLRRGKFLKGKRDMEMGDAERRTDSMINVFKSFDFIFSVPKVVNLVAL